MPAWSSSFLSEASLPSTTWSKPSYLLIKSATKNRLKPINKFGINDLKTINKYKFSRLAYWMILGKPNQGDATMQAIRNLAKSFAHVSLSKWVFIKPGRYFWCASIPQKAPQTRLTSPISINAFYWYPPSTAFAPHIAIKFLSHSAGFLKSFLLRNWWSAELEYWAEVQLPKP